MSNDTLDILANFELEMQALTAEYGGDVETFKAPAEDSAVTDIPPDSEVSVDQTMAESVEEAEPDDDIDQALADIDFGEFGPDDDDTVH